MLTMWDVGGQATKLWKHYFDKIDAILFVVDATCDAARLAKNKAELIKVCKDASLEGVPLLMMFNKCDLLPEDSNGAELCAKLSTALGVE